MIFQKVHEKFLTPENKGRNARNGVSPIQENAQNEAIRVEGRLVFGSCRLSGKRSAYASLMLRRGKHERKINEEDRHGLDGTGEGRRKGGAAVPHGGARRVSRGLLGNGVGNFKGQAPEVSFEMMTLSTFLAGCGVVGGASLRRNTEYACGSGEREGECGIVEL